LTFEKIHISQLETCPVCGSKPEGFPMPLKSELIEEICGRSGRRVFVITPRRNLELSMGDLYKFLKKKDFRINVNADLGITFNKGNRVTGSILKSGIMIVEGVNDKDGAFDFYSRILIDGIGVKNINIFYREVDF
jgi:hypothetical protein